MEENQTPNTSQTPEFNIGNPSPLAAELNKLSESVYRVKSEIHKVIVGQDQMIDLLLAGLFTSGHIILEGVPGIAKTLTAKLLAKTLSVNFSRIQFTPDLMPTDVIGTTVFNMKSSEFNFKKGPVFSNIVLIDEINRSPAKTQAALFEVMEERQITVDGVTHYLEFPFFVVATQNPIEQEGTYPLPEAQVDRFMLKVIVGYPSKAEELQIIRQNTIGPSMPAINAVASPSEILEAKELVRAVYIDEKVENYILNIVFATRFPDEYQLGKLKPIISFGGSPRASINLAIAAKAYAYLNKRAYVIPEDVRNICKDVLRHRIGLTYEAEAENVNVEDVINEILKAVNVP